MNIFLFILFEFPNWCLWSLLENSHLLLLLISSLHQSYCFLLQDLPLCLRFLFTLFSMSLFHMSHLCLYVLTLCNFSHLLLRYLFSCVQSSSYSTHWLFNKNCCISHFYKFYLVLYQNTQSVLIVFYLIFNTLIYFCKHIKHTDFIFCVQSVHCLQFNVLCCFSWLFLMVFRSLLCLVSLWASSVPCNLVLF